MDDQQANLFPDTGLPFRIIEAADTLHDKDSLTISWATGEETCEIVSWDLATFLKILEDSARAAAKAEFRAGRRVSRNVYRDEQPWFVAETEQQASELIAALAVDPELVKRVTSHVNDFQGDLYDLIMCSQHKAWKPVVSDRPSVPKAVTQDDLRIAYSNGVNDYWADLGIEAPDQHGAHERGMSGMLELFGAAS